MQRSFIAMPLDATTIGPNLLSFDQTSLGADVTAILWLCFSGKCFFLKVGSWGHFHQNFTALLKCRVPGTPILLN